MEARTLGGATLNDDSFWGTVHAACIVSMPMRVKSMKSQCDGQPDISTRSRVSQHARQMGDRADGFLLFGDITGTC